MKTKSLFLVVLLLVLSFSCKKKIDPDDNKEKIKIGFLHNFSGTTDKSRLYAIQLAIEEINASGGIYGRELELLFEDTKSDTILIKQLAQNMIDSGVVAILGLNSSTQALVMSKSVTIPAGIVYIGYLATSPALTSLSDNNLVWRTIPSDAFQGNAAAQFAKDSLLSTKVSIIYIENTYGSGLAETFKNKFISLSGSVMNYIAVPSTVTDFSSYLSTVFSGNPDLIYLVTESEQAANFTNQAQLYLNNNPNIEIPKILGCDGNYSTDKFLPTADINFSVGFVGTNPSTKTNDVNYTLFIDNYTTKYGAAPTASYVSQAYDAIYLLAFAMYKIGEEILEIDENTIISSKIAQNLRKVSGGDPAYQGTTINVNQFAAAKTYLTTAEINYKGASGDVDFDENGDIKSGYYQIWEVFLNNDELQYKTRSYIQFP